MFRQAALVALCGGAGSVARWAVAGALARVAPGRLPWGTLLVNVVGSAAIGFVMAWFGKRGALETNTRLALTVGLLGGFTTMSAFAWETVALGEVRAWGRAGVYVTATVVLCLAACAAGAALGRASAN